MKKQLLLISSMVVMLSGCSKLDQYIGKIPFINKQENSTAPEKVQPPEEKVNGGNTITDNSTADSNEEPENTFTLSSQFFNEIKEVNGKNVIQNPTNIMALVNKQYAFPSDYTPSDLVRPDVPFSFGNEDLEKSYLRKEAAEALEKMFHSANKKGINLYAVSGYRSYDRQAMLFDAEVSQVGKKKAVLVVAIPGSSEHQSGLAMDISSKSANLVLSEEFGKTTEGKWLAKNAHKYGYILRYPKGKETITGYQFEPWHFRYVGKEAAKVIYENNWTLEEYFHIVEKI